MPQNYLTASQILPVNLEPIYLERLEGAFIAPLHKEPGQSKLQGYASDTAPALCKKCVFVSKCSLFFCVVVFSISAAVKSHVVGLWSGAACVCRPCGHTAGFETRGWGGETLKATEREIRGWGRGESDSQLLHISHRGVLQRWGGSQRGSSLASVCYVLPTL